MICARLQEASEAVEVAARLHEANLGQHGVLVDQLREGHVAKVELAGHAHHVSVESLFHDASIGADAQLATEHDVKGMGRRTASLIPDLDPRDLLGASSLTFEPFRNGVRDQLAKVDLPQGDMPVLIARDVAKVALGQGLGETLGQHHRAVVLFAGLSS